MRTFLNLSFLSKINIFVISILLASFLTPSFAQEEKSDEQITRNAKEIYSDLSLFGDVFDRIRAQYVDAPDERELIRAAIDGMLSSLDPHSGYLSPRSYEDMMQDTSGEFGGLGIEVTMEEGVVKVVAPIDDTPAFRAGLLANDYIVEIDGEQVQGMTLDQAVGKMRGLIGTEIFLVVVREGIDEPLEFTIVRDVIAVRAVRYVIEKDIGIIRLSRFSEQAYSGIEKAIRDIYQERNDVAPKGLILDLRNNPGGLVDQAVYVADAFLDRGAIVLTRARNEQESNRYEANADDLDRLIKDIPLVILINGGSASSSEILAGALQDHKRATLVGTRSFGKGTVQSIISLGQNGAMRLTTSRYYTPNNRSIQALGIVPDIEIFQDVPDELKGRDEIVGEAALKGHINGEEKDENGEETKERTAGSSVYIPSDTNKDTQRNYAIDLILGIEKNDAYPPNPNE